MQWCKLLSLSFHFPFTQSTVHPTFTISVVNFLNRKTELASIETIAIEAQFRTVSRLTAVAWSLLRRDRATMPPVPSDVEWPQGKWYEYNHLLQRSDLLLFSHRVSQSSLKSSNPFDDDEMDDSVSLNDSFNNGTLRQSMTRQRKKRRAPPPPPVRNLVIHAFPRNIS